MKQINMIWTASLAVVAAITMTACSSDSSGGSGGSGGGGSLAAGGFFQETIVTTTTPDGSYQYAFSDTKKRLQMLYGKDAVRSSSGYIDAISFIADEETVNDIHCPNVTIQIGENNVTALSTTYAQNTETGQGSMQTVMDDKELTIPATGADQYFTIALDTPFFYSGKNNLVVDIKRAAACDGTIAMNYRTSTDDRLLFSNFPNATGGIATQKYFYTKFHFKGGNDQLSTTGGSTDIHPFNTVSKMQTLYRHDRINGAGPITAVGYQLSDEAYYEEVNLTVTLGHTSLNVLSDTSASYRDNFSDTPVVAADNVKVVIPAGTPAGSWIWIPLEKSFNYNGTDNLIVQLERLEGSGSLQDVAAPTLMIPGQYRTVYGAGDTPSASTLSFPFMKLRFHGALTEVEGSVEKSIGIPFTGVDLNSTIQSLYQVSSLGAAGKIESLSLQLFNDADEGAYDGFKIVIGHTQKSEVEATLADNLDGATTVYDGIFTVPAGLKAGDWIEVPFDRAYHYNGRDNLVVQLSSNHGNVTNYVKAFKTTQNTFAFAYRDSETAIITDKYVYKLRFNITR